MSVHLFEATIQLPHEAMSDASRVIDAVDLARLRNLDPEHIGEHFSSLLFVAGVLAVRGIAKAERPMVSVEPVDFSGEDFAGRIATPFSDDIELAGFLHETGLSKDAYLEFPENDPLDMLCLGRYIGRNRYNLTVARYMFANRDEVNTAPSREFDRMHRANIYDVRKRLTVSTMQSYLEKLLGVKA